VLARANLLADAGRHDEAVPLFQSLVDAGAAPLNLNLGLSHLERGDLEAARRAFLQGAAAGSDDCRYELAQILEHDGDVAAAEAIYTDLAARGDPESTFALAVVHANRGHLARAVELLEPLAEREDDVGEHASATLGVLRFELGDDAGAEVVLRRGWTRSGAALSRLLELLERRGSTAEAEVFRRAARANGVVPEGE
jgi:tetratricopeptide (TPR) repeat protein